MNPSTRKNISFYIRYVILGIKSGDGDGFSQEFGQPTEPAKGPDLADSLKIQIHALLCRIVPDKAATG